MNKRYNTGSLAERFWPRVRVLDNGCWEWLGAHNGNGYGVLRINGKNYLAHRVSWMLNRGGIPKGLFVCHDCDNPGCVSPGHLFLGTQADNMRDMETKGRSRRGQRELEKTHCPRGHPYSGVNLYVNPRGSRICRECYRAAQRCYRERKRRLRAACQFDKSAVPVLEW